MPFQVTAIRITPVKGTRIREVDSVQVTPHGVRENRRFFLIDDNDDMVNATHLGPLQTIVSDYSHDDRRLALTFPDGRVLEGEVRLGDELTTGFYKEPFPARLVLGDWSEAISDHCGKSLRLVEPGDGGAVDRGALGTITLISRASVSRLAEHAERSGVDARRFRMLLEVDGIDPHEEDSWIGRELRIGETVLRGRGHVGRCVITNRDPDTGEIDLQTLKILGSYRRGIDTTEPIAIGIYGEVIKPGMIRVGDSVEVERVAEPASAVHS
jgi:MOSC domain-containing protein